MNSRERFLAACRCEPVDRLPVWLMRQAGRYLPEYREIREKYSFLEMCRRPDLAVEISLQPWRRFGMDAVIVFSDILLPIAAMGLKLSFEKDIGPRFDRKIQSREDVDGLPSINVRLSLPFVMESLDTLRHEIRDDAALLGFVGAPWTLACYMTEGGSGNFSAALGMVRKDPDLMDRLLEHVTHAISSHAVEQVRAGADAIQIFDTWAGILDERTYANLVLPKVARICSAVKNAGGIPIFFIRDSEKMLGVMGETGANVISIGHKTDLSEAWKILGDKTATQGNLDPEILAGSPASVAKATSALVEKINGRKGHIVNLGHGVLPHTRPDSVKAMIDAVKGG